MSQTRSNRRFVSLGPDGWTESRGRHYRYIVYLSGSEGKYTATASTVVGVTATGSSPDETLETIRTQLLALLRQSKASGEPMPRGDVAPPAGSVSKGVFIDLGED